MLRSARSSYRALATALTLAVVCTSPIAADELMGWFQLAPEAPDGKTPFAVQGWVLATCGPAEAVVAIDGQEIWRGSPFTTWPGVADRYPGVDGADRAGFWMQVDPTRFDVGEHRLEVSVAACERRKAVGAATFTTLAATPLWIAVPMLALLLGGLPWLAGRWLAHREPTAVELPWLQPAIAGLYLSVAAIIVAAPQLAPSVIAVDGGLFASLANWDGRFYTGLATQGYSPEVPAGYAFFPLYPLLLRALNVLPVPLELTAALVNIGLFVVLLGLLRRLFPGRDPGLAFFACLPFACFFVATYTETLALTLAAAFVVALHRGRLAQALLWGILAGLTRITCLPLALFALDALRRRQWRQAAVAVAAPCLGLGAWMLWLRRETGDAMSFLTLQADFGRTTPFHPGRLFDLLAAGLTSGRLQTLWELAFLFLALLGAAALVQRGHWGAGSYSTAVALMPLFTMRLAALNRYALLAFPAWILLGSRLGERGLWRAVVAVEVVVLSVYAARFGLQYWVG